MHIFGTKTTIAIQLTNPDKIDTRKLLRLKDTVGLYRSDFCLIYDIPKLAILVDVDYVEVAHTRHQEDAYFYPYFASRISWSNYKFVLITQNSTRVENSMGY